MTASTTAPQPTTAEPASIARRFAGLFVDWLLCLAVTGLFGVRLATSGFIPVAILVVEYTFFVGLFAQTPGMFVAGARCVSVHDGRQIGILSAFLRGILLVLVIPVFIMRDGRFGHDRAVGSVVIRSRGTSS